MNLTVAQVAHAVGKSETYVRQHIHRKHLNARREGRTVYVDHEEVARWARERGLPFVLQDRTSFTTTGSQSRIARMTILALQQKNGRSTNLFTHIRHRRRDTLGPWASVPDKTWVTTTLLTAEANEEQTLQLHSLDATLGYCQELVDHILDEGILEIDDLEIRYALQHRSRRHRAYRDERTEADPSVPSPFSNHSADVLEYWSFAQEPEELWLELIELPPADLQAILSHLGFPLDRRSDHIGNLMISGAEDAIVSDLAAIPNGKLVLTVDGKDLAHGAYTAAVWAKHSGDDVVRQQVPITNRETVIDLESDVDHIGFAMYRGLDGQYIDLHEVGLIMEVSGAINISGGPTLQLRDRRSSTTDQVNPWGTRYALNIKFDEHSPLQDREIRRLFLARRNQERKSDARQVDVIERFGADQFEMAVEYFLSLLSRHSYQDAPLYLADPHFMSLDHGDPEKRLYLGMVEAMAGRPLRVLCAPLVPERPWWTSFPNLVTDRITVRAFVTQRGGGRAFHDRYLIAADTEILITNSFNGWSSGGLPLLAFHTACIGPRLRSCGHWMLVQRITAFKSERSSDGHLFRA